MNSVPPPRAFVRTPTKALRQILAVCLTLAGVFGCSGDAEPEGTVAGAASTGTSGAGSAAASGRVLFEQASRNGHFQVAFGPREGQIPVGRLHEWTIQVRDAEGALVVPTRLRVGGGMPSHGHGLVTQPQVTDALEDGRYRVEGMQFHMSGPWQLQVEVVAGGIGDVAEYEIEIAP